MRTMEHFRNRRSVRSFTKDDVPDEVIANATAHVEPPVPAA